MPCPVALRHPDAADAGPDVPDEWAVAPRPGVAPGWMGLPTYPTTSSSSLTPAAGRGGVSLEQVQMGNVLPLGVERHLLDHIGTFPTLDKFESDDVATLCC